MKMHSRPWSALIACAAAFVGGCGGDTPADPPSPEEPWLTVLSLNVGNLDEPNGGPCGVKPYYGGLCSIAQEEVIAERFALLRPDVAVLTELVDSSRCDEDPQQGDADFVCTDADSRSPKEQVRRLVGEQYTVSCSSTRATCVVANPERVTLSGCDDGALCLDGNNTPARPAECGDKGPRNSVSRIDGTRGNTTFATIAVHALRALNEEDDPCRKAEFAQAFESLSSETNALLAGDWNMDPYRAPDAFESGDYWHTQVGEGNRFTAHNVPSDGSMPLPTWAKAATVDYVLSDFLTGDCQTLGESEGTERIDGEELATLDHRGLWCAFNP